MKTQTNTIAFFVEDEEYLASNNTGVYEKYMASTVGDSLILWYYCTVFEVATTTSNNIEDNVFPWCFFL